MAGTGNMLVMQRALTSAPPNVAIKKQKEKPRKESIVDKEIKCESEAPICRICLMEDQDLNDPLIAPCKCAGSMGLVHCSCLKTWFGNKRVVKQTNVVTTYFWKNLECELCKHPYPCETKTLDGR